VKVVAAPGNAVLAVGSLIYQSADACQAVINSRPNQIFWLPRQQSCPSVSARADAPAPPSTLSSLRRIVLRSGRHIGRWKQRRRDKTSGEKTNQPIPLRTYLRRRSLPARLTSGIAVMPIQVPAYTPQKILDRVNQPHLMSYCYINNGLMGIALT